MNPEIAAKNHAELSKAINHITVTLITLCLFSLLTLSAADKAIVGATATVKVPIANTDTSYSAFLYIAPLMLICISLFLHSHLFTLRQLNKIVGEARLPVYINLPGFFPKVVAAAICYGMVPATLLYFSWRAVPRPDGVYIFCTTLAFSIYSVSSVIMVGNLSHKKPIAVLVAFILISTSPIFFHLYKKIPYNLNLYAVDLSSKDLAYFNFFGADLRRVTINKSDLKKVILSKADLRYATIKEVNLRGANLSMADFRGSELSEVNIRDADLTCTHFEGVDLSNSIIDIAEYEATAGVVEEAKKELIAQFKNSCINEDTRFPYDLEIQARTEKELFEQFECVCFDKYDEY